MMPSVTIASHLHLWVWHTMSLPYISSLMLSLFLPIFCLPENCPRSFKSFSSSSGGRKLYSAHLEFLWFLAKLPTYPLPPPGHAHRCHGDLSVYLCSRSSSCHVKKSEARKCGRSRREWDVIPTLCSVYHWVREQAGTWTTPEHRPEGHKGSGEQGLRVAKPAVSTWGVLGWIILKTHSRDLADVKSPGQAFYNGQVPSFQRSLVRVVESSISEKRAPRGIHGAFIEGVTFEMDLERWVEAQQMAMSEIGVPGWEGTGCATMWRREEQGD